MDDLIPILFGLEGLALSVAGVTCFGEEWRLSRVDTARQGWKLDKQVCFIVYTVLSGSFELLSSAGWGPRGQSINPV